VLITDLFFIWYLLIYYSRTMVISVQRKYQSWQLA